MGESYSKSRQINTFYGCQSSFWRTGFQGAGSGFQPIAFHSLSLGTRSASGSLNPRWRTQVAQGINATTSFVATDYFGPPLFIDAIEEFTVTSRTNPGINGHYFYSLTGFYYPGHLAALDAVPTSVVADVKNRCIRQFIQKVNEVRSSGNLTGRSLKHLKHDLHNVSNPLAPIRAHISGYLDQLMKVGRNARYRGALIRDIRSAYLEFQFGIKPFTEDLTEILIDVSRQRDFDVVPVQASKHSTWSAKETSTGISPTGYLLITPTSKYVKTSTYYCRFKGAVRTGRNSNGQVGWLQDNRLLPRDWLPTLWSILPYAWMINYFTNIDDIIDGLSFVFSDLTWGCGTERQETLYNGYLTWSTDLSAFWPPATYNVQILQWPTGGPSSTWGSRSVSRYALTPSDLVPSLTFKVPTKPIQYVNMLAALLPRITRVASFLTKLGKELT